MGLDGTTTMTLFYQQIILNKELPFVKIPNEETINAINEDLI